MLRVKGALFYQKPPHPVTSRILEMLVLLVSALHQCGECEVFELVAAALLRPVVFCEAAAAIRALIVVVDAIVVIDAFANQRRIRIFLVWLNVFLDVANRTRRYAVTSRVAEAWRAEQTH
jgi:hypothetical protein